MPRCNMAQRAAVTPWAMTGMHAPLALREWPENLRLFAALPHELIAAISIFKVNFM